MIKIHASDMMICESSGETPHSVWQLITSAYTSVVTY